MKKQTLYNFSLLFILGISNINAQNFQLVSDKNFALEVPNYLKADFDLNNDASMQLSNSQKEIYLIVIEDLKDDLNNPNQSLEFYQNFVIQQLTSPGFLDNVKVNPPAFKRINGLKAMETSITGDFDSEFRVWYRVVAYESKTHFYQLIIWTLENQKALYAEDFKHIVSTFREL